MLAENYIYSHKNKRQIVRQKCNNPYAIPSDKFDDDNGNRCKYIEIIAIQRNNNEEGLSAQQRRYRIVRHRNSEVNKNKNHRYKANPSDTRVVTWNRDVNAGRNMLIFGE